MTPVMTMASIAFAVSVVSFLLGTCLALWLKPRAEPKAEQEASKRTVAGLQLEIEQLKEAFASLNDTGLHAVCSKVARLDERLSAFEGEDEEIAAFNERAEREQLELREMLATFDQLLQRAGDMENRFVAATQRHAADIDALVRTDHALQARVGELQIRVADLQAQRSGGMNDWVTTYTCKTTATQGADMQNGDTLAAERF